MPIYPSLEDMKVDQMLTVQETSWPATAPTLVTPHSTSGLYPPQPDSQTSEASAPPNANNGQVYPSLMDYMGLELNEETIRLNMPEYLSVVPRPPTTVSVAGSTMHAPLSSECVRFEKSQIHHGIRQVILCKDKDGKVGLRVKAINKGVFVCLVTQRSPAALAGLRFGDQILQINGCDVAGFSDTKVYALIKKADANRIEVAVRDRPLERTVTLHKDSTGHLGFQFKGGKISAIAVNSSAARNGLLTEHALLEVDGQNVVGIQDKQIARIIEDAGQTVTIAVMPAFLFEHIMKSMSSSLVKKMMDHSVPDC